MIIITTQCFAPKIGGIESLMTGMAESMSDLGKNVLVLADGNESEKDKKSNYKIKRFNSWKPVRRIQKAIYLKKICKENEVEAIYADSWKSLEYISNLKKKIIVLAHGTEIPKQYWSKILNLFRFKKNRITYSYKKATLIIANSGYTKELMNASLKIPHSKIHIIHPGIDIYEGFISKTDEYKIKKIIDNKFPVITTLARVEKRKGHKYIIKAINEIKDEFPNIIYLIAGKGPYLNEIKSYARKLDVEKNIAFLGWITEPEKSLVLKNSNLFVMTPSIVGESVEGFGMAFIDAAFHGVATIGTYSGGIPDAIIDEESGLLCEPENQKDITEKIKIILSDNEKRKKMGIAGRKRALTLFTWKNKIKEYLNVLELI